jgi:transposase
VLRRGKEAVNRLGLDALLASRGPDAAWFPDQLETLGRERIQRGPGTFVSRPKQPARRSADALASAPPRWRKAWNVMRSACRQKTEVVCNSTREGRPGVQYLGIDWGYRRAAFCALSEGGAITGEGFIAADEDGLTKLVLACGTEVKACVEMMSGSVWVRDQLAAVGWRVQVAHAREVRDVAPLACKTDKVDARVLVELCRRDLVSELWVASLQDRALRERLRRRMHLVRMRASAQNRIFGLLTQWGLRLSVKQLREPDAMALLEARGVEQVWRRSIAEALAVIDLLDQRIAPLEVELATLARADERVALLRTIPGVGDLLGLTIATEIGDVSRFATPRKLIGYAGLAPHGQPVRRPLPLRRAVEVRLTHAALGGRRGRPPGLARDQPLAPALPLDRRPRGQKPQPSPPSRARSSSRPGTSSAATSPSSPPAPASRRPSRQAPAPVWPPDGPAWN